MMPARKTSVKKVPAKRKPRAKNVILTNPIVTKAEEGLKKVEAMVANERKALAAAKAKVDEARAKAKKTARAADKNAVKRAAAAAEKLNAKLKASRAKVADTKAAVANAKALARIKASEAAVKQKIEERSTALASKADADLAKAVKLFEQRFKKKRLAANKLKLASIEK